jgi:hypothetical protein
MFGPETTLIANLLIKNVILQLPPQTRLPVNRMVEMIPKGAAAAKERERTRAELLWLIANRLSLSKKTSPPRYACPLFSSPENCP